MIRAQLGCFLISFSFPIASSYALSGASMVHLLYSNHFGALLAASHLSVVATVSLGC